MALINSEILRNNPVGSALDPFRDGYNVICENLGLLPSTEAFGQIGDNSKSSTTPHELSIQANLHSPQNPRP